MLPKGYYGDPEKTAKTFLEIGGERYIVPGDWARSRGDGTIELLGRLSAVVNTGGEKVFPAEVEEVLLAHPIGRRRDRLRPSRPALRRGRERDDRTRRRAPRSMSPTCATIVGARLAGFKKPRHIFVRPTLDRSLTGKVELARVSDDALARTRGTRRELAR